MPEAEWSHLAHVRVAWLYLTTVRGADALDRLRSGIRRYNTRVLRRPDRYHETVTVAFARILASRLVPGEDFSAFCSRIGDVLDRNSPVLLQYYSARRLFSDEARNRFIEPDLLPLPTGGDPHA